MNIANLGMLLSVSPALVVVLSIIMLAVGGGLGFGITAIVINKKTKSARANADKIVEEARNQANKIKQEQIEQANKEINLLKSTFEQENRERREETKRNEERIFAREEILSGK